MTGSDRSDFEAAIADAAPPAVAVLPIRGGVLPVGAAEVVAEAGGPCVLIGRDPLATLQELEHVATHAGLIDAEGFEPRRWASILSRFVPPSAHVLLPQSPDGRDLAPHLAAVVDRPLVAGATQVGRDRAVVARHGGLTMETLSIDRPIVATFQLGVRAVPEPAEHRPSPVAHRLAPIAEDLAGDELDPGGSSVRLIEELPADPATMDLAEAPLIVAGGAGLGDREHFELLHPIAERLGASVGATRVVTDWGWLATDRQIGTTGVMVDPDLYLAVGISGAVQHTAGLGQPRHVVVVNTDPSCPMMDLADLAVVCDGPAFLAALLVRLERVSRTSARPSHHRGPDLEA